MVLLANVVAMPSLAMANVDELRAELESMGLADQAVRAKMTPALLAKATELQALSTEMDVVDSKNLARLRTIIAKHGWPNVRVVGRDAANAAFLIVQHSPLEAQKEFLPLMKDAVATGNARADQLAMLQDRILTREGMKQRYGTQITAGPDGIPRVDPIEDPATLDERRASVGLPSMEQYLKLLEAQIGAPIDRSALEQRWTARAAILLCPHQTLHRRQPLRSSNLFCLHVSKWVNDHGESDRNWRRVSQEQK